MAKLVDQVTNYYPIRRNIQTRPDSKIFVSRLEKSLAGQTFESSEEVITATKAYLADLEKNLVSRLVKKVASLLSCVAYWKQTILKNIATFQKFFLSLGSHSTYRTILVYHTLRFSFVLYLYELLLNPISKSYFYHNIHLTAYFYTTFCIWFNNKKALVAKIYMELQLVTLIW